MSLRARMEKLKEGEVYQGVVDFIAPFGLFVQLVPGQKYGLLRFDHTPYPEIARQLREGDTVEVVASTVDVGMEKVRVELLPDSTRYSGFWSRLPAVVKPIPDTEPLLS